MTGLHLTLLFQACLDNFEYSFTFCSCVTTNVANNIVFTDEVFSIYFLHVEPVCTILVLKWLLKTPESQQENIKGFF